MTDREKILALIKELIGKHLDDNNRAIAFELSLLIEDIHNLPAEPVPMVRWRTVIETSVGIDEEFHTSREGAEEYLESMAGRYPQKITRCEIREVKDE